MSKIKEALYEYRVNRDYTINFDTLIVTDLDRREFNQAEIEDWGLFFGEFLPGNFPNFKLM